MHMPVEHAMARMLTCATVEKCAREEACFVVVQWAREQFEALQTREALTRATVAAAQEEVECYAPHFPPALDWEWARPDWDAA